LSLLPLPWQQLADGPPPFGVAPGAKITRRLMQGHVELPSRSHLLAIHGHAVRCRVDFCAQFPCSLSIDLHSSGQDKLLAGAPGSHAAICEKLLQPNGFHAHSRSSDIRVPSRFARTTT